LGGGGGGGGTSLSTGSSYPITSSWAESASYSEFKSYPVTTESSGFRTLGLSDAFTYIRLTNATSCSITVPSQSVVSWPDTVDIVFRIAAAGLPNFVTASTITITNGAFVSAMAQHSTFALKKVATDVWDLI
jgi:hypothetical protein